MVHGPHESQGGARVLTVQHWQSHDGSFDFHPAEEASAGGGGGAAARASGGRRHRRAGERNDAGAAGKGGETPAAAAQRGEAEQSLGKGYG